MKKLLNNLALVIITTLGTSIIAVGSAATISPKVVIETSLGNITVEVYSDKAPLSAKHFLDLVNQGLYRNASFYRAARVDNWPAFEMHGEAVKISENESRLIQGGISAWPVTGFEEDIPMIAHESTNQTGIQHIRGTISWTRGKVGTAQSEFFICLDEMPYLDSGGWPADGQGYAAFGRVIKGMNIVEKINQQSTNDNGSNIPDLHSQGIAEPIAILRVYSLSTLVHKK